MRTEVSGLKWLLMVAFAAGALLASRDASAIACTNDIECPDAACGGQVCDWNVNPIMTCKAAGGAAKGLDGWCATTDDCKCKGMGATCNAPYCTFTRACDAPGGAGCSAAGTGGSSGAGTGGSSGAGTGGSSGATGGSSGATGGSSGTGTGGSAPKDSGGGGCAIGGKASSSLLGAMIGLGAFLATRRRRNRA